MAIEVADAYVALYAKFGNSPKKEIEQALGAAVPAATAKPAAQLGDGLLKGASNVIKGGALALGGLVAAGLGTALVKGFQRLDALDQAQAKLSGLGHSAQGVDQIMNNALASVKGTAFGMGDAATVAATVVAAGIKPGEDLERTLKLVGDAATIAGTDMSSMGSVIAKVATSDMMQLDVANQLMDAGIPILQLLAAEMGVTADEARAMASAGQISFEDFQNALESGLGGAALESGNTFQGAMDNVMAAVGRLGESLLGGVFEDMKGEFGDLTEWLDGLGPAFEDIGQDIGAFASEAIPIAVDVLTQFIDVLIGIATWVNSNSGWLTPLAIGIAAVVGAVTAWIAVSRAYSATMAIVAAAQAAYTAATYGAAGATYAGTAATNAQRIAMIAAVAAQKIATAAQWAWNAAMSANPIMLIVLAIAALVGALIWFFTQTELGQEIWANFTQFLGDAWNWLWTSVIKPVVDWIAGALNWLWEHVIQYVVMGIVLYVQMWAAIFTWLWENVLSPVFTAIGAIFQWLYDFVITPIVMGVILYFKLWEIALTWLWNNVIKPVFEAIGAIFTWIYNYIITPIVTGVIMYIQMWATVITWLWQNIISPAFTAIGAIFTWLYENIVKPVWNGIQSAIQVVADWITGTLWPGIEKTLGYMGKGFEVLRDVITEVWENIKKAAIAPVNFVIETVWNDGIKATFDTIADKVGLDLDLPKGEPIRLASGGVLPGYTPGRDVHKFWSPTGGLLYLSGGEGIIRPDALRALGGKQWLDAVNSSRGQAFKDGGIWDAVGGTVSGAMDWLGSVATAVAEIVSDPLGAIDRLILDPVKGLLSDIGGGAFGEMVSQLPLQAIDGIKDWFSSMLAPTTMGATGGDWVGGNTVNRVMALMAGLPLVVTDTYRDPAYNAAVGGVPGSYHLDPVNPAIDVAGPMWAMDELYARVMANGPWRQVLYRTAGHWDHVHVAADGGVFGDLPTKKYDQGGYLQPGLSAIYNGTGKPEPVFTSDQWSLIEKMANGGGMPRELVVVDANGELIGRMRVEAADVAVRALEEVGR